MGVITVKHYKASNLPAELRTGLSDDALVSVTVEEEQTGEQKLEALLLLSQRQQARSKGVTTEEAVRRIRTLRDEWDD